MVVVPWEPFELLNRRGYAMVDGSSLLSNLKGLAQWQETSLEEICHAEKA